MLVAESIELKLSDYKYDEDNLHRVVEIYSPEGYTPYLNHWELEIELNINELARCRIQKHYPRQLSFY